MLEKISSLTVTILSLQIFYTPTVNFNKKTKEENNIETQKKLIAIDGSSLLSTCYFATLPKSIMYAKTDEEREEHYNEIMHSEDGIYTNGIYGSFRMLQSLVFRQKPDYMVVAFDVSRETFRRKLYPQYKGQRGKTQEPLKQQFITIQNLLTEMGIRVISGTEYEADDYIASVAKQFEGPSLSVRILTKDHDFLQLPSQYTKCWMMQSSVEKANELFDNYGLDRKDYNLPEKIFEFGEDMVLCETGVLPEQFSDLKAMIGDSSDNYPGIKGISSAAVPLLQCYGSIDGIYAAIDGCGGDKKKIQEMTDMWKNKLGIKRNPYNYLVAENDEELCGRKAAELFKVIAKMKTDIALGIELSDMECHWSVKKFNEICERLNIKTL